jgi:hypothetical protein
MSELPDGEMERSQSHFCTSLAELPHYHLLARQNLKISISRIHKRYRFSSTSARLSQMDAFGILDLGFQIDSEKTLPVSVNFIFKQNLSSSNHVASGGLYGRSNGLFWLHLDVFDHEMKISDSLSQSMKNTIGSGRKYVNLGLDRGAHYPVPNSKSQYDEMRKNHHLRIESSENLADCFDFQIIELEDLSITQAPRWSWSWREPIESTSDM